MDYKYINQLLERYWVAETTLEEEKILRTFFSQAEIPAELKPYQSLFAYEGSAKSNEKLGDDFDERMLAMVGESAEETARTITLRQRLMPLFRAAAIVAVILTLGNAIQKPFSDDETVGNIVGIENIGEGVSVAINIDSATIDTMRQSNLQMKRQEIGVRRQEAMD